MADKGSSNEGTSSSQMAGESSESTIEINVKTLDSKIYTFHVNKDLPVPMLKEMVVSAIGVPVEKQRLIFRGRVLKDEHLLSEYHLEDGHTLHLVVRQPAQEQPTPGAGSEDASHSNGSDSYGNAMRNRVGQVSHSVVLGTVNVADQGEGMVPDIGRLVGAVLNSLGVGTLAAAMGATNTSSTTVPSVDAEGSQNASGGTPSGNPAQPGFTTFNPPFQFFPQMPQFPPPGTVPRHMVIPDSLSTLLDFIGRLELVLQNTGSQSSPPSNVRGPLSSGNPSSTFRGLPTTELLGSVIQRAQQLLSGNAATSLSHFASRLEREGTSTDPGVRGHIQTEAVHIGMAMQHLGAMLLELGRATLTLRMGQSPAESLVNAGPAVYISPTGPNPIMVQPFPLQTASLFGVSPLPQFGGVPGTFGAGDPSRNINIHIHAGSPVAPGASSSATRSNSGEANQGERNNAEQANQNRNGSSDSSTVQGLHPRTVVTAIPGRPSTESGSHVLSVIYPVHVRSQQSVPIQLASSQGAHPTMSSGTQPNTAILIPQPSSESGSIPAVVAQINARVGGVPAASVHGQTSSQSLNSDDSHSSRSTMASGTQANAASSFLQTSSETNTIASLVTQINAQIANVLSGSVQGQSSSASAQPSNTSSAPEPEGAQAAAAGNCNRGTIESPVHCIGSAEDVKQRGQEGNGFSKTAGSSGSSDVESSRTSSVGGPPISQSSDAPSTRLVDKSSEKNSESSSTMHPSNSGPDGESDRSAPLGLGLGGLQPKRRAKPAKPVRKDGVSHGTPSVDLNQQSIARGQDVLRSLFSQSSDTNRVNTNGSSSPSPSVHAENMADMPFGGRGASGQINAGNMMSHVLQSPAFNSILTNVAEQTGVGSPVDFRSMLEQCTQSPAIRGTLNDIVHQVEGQGQDLGNMLLGSGRGQGGIDFSRLMQQMMPVVSQALGRGSTRSIPVNGVSFQPQLQSNDGRTGGHDILDDKSSQIDLHQACERIEQHDSPENIFRAVLESAGHLSGDDSYEGLAGELGDDMELTSEYMEMLRRDIHQRLQKESKASES